MSRHERTRLLLENHLPPDKVRFDVPLRVEIEPAAAQHPDAQLTFLTIVNMMVRVSDRFDIQAPGGILVHVWTPWGDSKDLLTRARQVAEPFQTVGHQEPAIVIRVGGGAAGDNISHASSRGWTGYAARGADLMPVYDAARVNPAGALVAAGLASAMAFHAMMRKLGALRLPDAASSVLFNALTLRPEPDAADAPAWPESPGIGADPATMVGAGAVGNAVVYALRALDARGTIKVIEPGEIKRTGDNRYLATPPTASGSKAKAVALHSSATLAIQPHVQEYRAWSAIQSSPPVIAISTVDDTRWNMARKDLQTDLPRNLSHAATGSDTFSVANIDFLQGPCLGCIVPEAAANEHLAHILASQLDMTVERARQVFYDGQPLQESEVRTIAQLLGRPFEELRDLVGKSGRDALARGQLCGLREVPLPDGIARPSVSFLSGLAGFLAALEVIKIANPSLARYVEPSLVRIPVYIPSLVDRMPGKLTSRCSVICDHPVLQSEWARLWKPVQSAHVEDAPKTTTGTDATGVS